MRNGKMIGLLSAAVCLGISGSLTRAERQTAANPRQSELLDADWRLHIGEIDSGSGVVSGDYDDAQWTRVDVPNDYVLNSPFSHAEDRGHGYRHPDVGWYRKHLSIPAADQGKILRLDFDGVFRDSQVWLNGQSLGEHKSGYTSFSYDISKIAKIGGDNVIAVRVDPRQFEGWWYEGGGIYRHVHLTVLDPVHVVQYGTYVVSTVPGGDEGADGEANISIKTNVQNQGDSGAQVEVVSEVLGPEGKSLRTLRSPMNLGANEEHEIEQSTSISGPKLWSLESPNLYQLRTTILREGKPTDSTTTPFGIRTIRFDVAKGFFLNGKHVEIQGVACHQDFAGVGIAVPDSIELWRVQQLKKMGCNGWRTAHDEPNAEVLDDCDRVGMLVMDENRHFGDTYRHHALPGTPADDLSDLACQIQRDRNHPSVIMWSMCNEEGLQGSPQGPHILRTMMDVVHRYDRTRPITSAINAGPKNKVFKNGGDASIEDILGINYHNTELDAFHSERPEKPMFGSEDCNEKTTRGQYVNDRAAGMSSGYNLSETTWREIAERPFMAGAYVWTGFDYKGEPNPYGWPDVSNNTGIMDSCGFPKDKYYYFESCWSDKPMVHLMPDSWGPHMQPGQQIRVIAFSNQPRVELFLNGRSLGSQSVPRNGHAEWQVSYQPGRLLAKAYGQGGAAMDQIETTGNPARIILSPDRTTLVADGEDAIVIPVALEDNQDRVVDTANRVTFQLTGGGKILGVGNGNPADHDPDKADARNAFHGKCMVVIQAGKNAGQLRLTASSPELSPGMIELQVKDQVTK